MSYLSLLFIILFSMKCYLQEDAILADEFINDINKNQSSWAAGRNWPKNTTLKFLHGLCGSKPRPSSEDFRRDYTPPSVDPKDIPKNFNAYRKWPFCHTIIEPRTQGACGSCWATASASVMSDRICITSNGSETPHISSEDLLTCCSEGISENGDGCEGGYADKTWKCWNDIGVVTGGEVHSKEGCKPYSERSYFDSKGSRCIKKCTNQNYSKSYKKDKYYGSESIFSGITDIRNIQSEILLNGPVVAVMRVFDDFYAYRHGIYKNLRKDSSKNYHSVKIIGWGEEDDENYWLGVNTWGTVWGELNGLFKIKWGESEIEGQISAGLVNAGGKIAHWNIFLLAFVAFYVNFRQKNIFFVKTNTYFFLNLYTFCFSLSFDALFGESSHYIFDLSHNNNCYALSEFQLPSFREHISF